MEFTRNNHLKISHAVYSKEFDVPYTVTDIGDPQQTSKNSLQLASEAALEWYEKNGSKRVNLFLSGGIDSECMLLAFLKSKVPFQIVAVQFKNDLNKHDFDDLLSMCQRHSVKPLIKQYDIINFYESGRHFDLAEKYLSRSPQFTAHFEFLQMVEGPSLMAWQPLKISLNQNQPELILPHDSNFSYCRFIEGAGLSASPFFFMYTPELIASFTKKAMRSPVLNGQLNGTSYLFKVFQYQQGGFNITARADKYTGFELVKDYYQSLYPSQIDSFNYIYRIPIEKKFPIPYSYYRYNANYLNF